MHPSHFMTKASRLHLMTEDECPAEGGGQDQDEAEEEIEAKAAAKGPRFPEKAEIRMFHPRKSLKVAKRRLEARDPRPG